MKQTSVACFHLRCAIPEELPVHCQNDPEAPVPCVCTYLPPALQGGGPAERGGSPQHVLQALHLLCAGVQPHRQKGASASTGAY